MPRRRLAPATAAPRAQNAGCAIHSSSGSGAIHRHSWFEDAATLRLAFFRAIGVVHPTLPPWLIRPTILKNCTMVLVDNLCDVGVDRVNPSKILLEKGCVILLRGLWVPLASDMTVVRLRVIIYIWMKEDRAGELPTECHLELVRVHASNIPDQQCRRSSSQCLQVFRPSRFVIVRHTLRLF